MWGVQGVCWLEVVHNTENTLCFSCCVYYCKRFLDVHVCALLLGASNSASVQKRASFWPSQCYQRVAMLMLNYRDSAIISLFFQYLNL